MLFITNTALPIRHHLENLGHEVLEVDENADIKNIIAAFLPDEIHVMTKLSFRKRGHIRKHPFIAHISSKDFPRFYKKAAKIFVPNQEAKKLLENMRGFPKIEIFSPFFEKWDENETLSGLEKPIFLYYEDENVERFCQMPLPGTKVVIGKKIAKYQDQVHFYPKIEGIEKIVLPRVDVLIYPHNQQFSHKIFIQAASFGVAIATVFSIASKSFIINGLNGFISEDLFLAALKCLNIDEKDCKKQASRYSVENSLDQLLFK